MLRQLFFITVFLFTALGVQAQFRAEFNYLAAGTPANGGEYALVGLFEDGDTNGFTYDSLDCRRSLF